MSSSALSVRQYVFQLYLYVVLFVILYKDRKAFPLSQEYQVEDHKWRTKKLIQAFKTLKSKATQVT